MVLEQAEVVVRAEVLDAFLSMLREQALPLTESFRGLISFRALRGIERQGAVLFLVEWESVEAHIRSHDDPAHRAFRALVQPYISESRDTEHFRPL